MKSLVYTLVLSWALLLSAASLQAQTPRLDSLVKVLATQKQDTNRINTLLLMSSCFGIDRLKNAILSANEALTLAKKLNALKHIKRAYWQIGSTYLELNQDYETNQKALDTFLILLKLSQTTDKDRDKAWVHRALGTVYSRQNKLPEALTHHYKALSLFQKEDNQQLQAEALQLIAATFISQGDYQEALKNLLESLKIRRRLSFKSGIVQSLNTIATVHHNQGHHAQALHYSLTALKLVKEPNFEGPAWMLPFTYSTLGEIYESQGDKAHLSGNKPKAFIHYQAALKNFLTALALWKKMKAQDGIVEATLMAGNLNRKLNQLPTAERLLHRGLKGAVALQYNDYLMRAYRFLTQLDSTQGNYSQAYWHYKSFIVYRDNIYNQQKTQQLTEVKMQYAFEKKDALVQAEQQKKAAQIQLLQQKTQQAQFRSTALLVIGGLVLLLGAAVSVWLLNRSRLRRLEEAQQLRTQIAQDLHDEVGSTLSSISMLSSHIDTLLRQNRAESAQKVIQKVYSDARQILESMDEIIWTIKPSNDSLQRILLRLQTYAQPLMESKGIQFSFQITTEVAQVPIPIEHRRNVYLIGKEALTNLAKYSQATQALVRITKADHQLQVWIEDNGQGFDPTQPSQRTGQVSMQQRAQAMGGRLRIHSAPGQGTRLELRVTI
ncbi:hypothetical protein GCM10027592_56720 [Spirosoma flavus]